MPGSDRGTPSAGRGGCLRSRAVGQAGPDAHYLHVRTVIANVVANLFQAANRRKIGNRVSEDIETGLSQTGCQPRHVLLGNAGIEEAILELLPQTVRHALSQIADDQEGVVVRRGLSEQLFDKGIAHIGRPEVA